LERLGRPQNLGEGILNNIFGMLVKVAEKKDGLLIGLGKDDQDICDAYLALKQSLVVVLIIGGKAGGK